jgi:hypothetical protein
MLEDEQKLPARQRPPQQGCWIKPQAAPHEAWPCGQQVPVATSQPVPPRQHSVPQAVAPGGQQVAPTGQQVEVPAIQRSRLESWQHTLPHG